MTPKQFFVEIGVGVKNVFVGKANDDNLYALDGRPKLTSALPFGIQHVLAMFASNIAPIIIVFEAIGLLGTDFSIYSMLGALFMAGIGTIVQLLIGARLPIVIGTSFTFVPIFITIGINAGGGEAAYYTIMGSIIAAGGIATFLVIFFRYWSRLIKPIVPAIVVLGIGLSLLASGANQFLGGSSIIASVIATGNTGTGVPYYAYILVALATILAAFLWSLLVKGIWRNIYIIVGIAVGYIISCCIPGMVDFSRLAIDTNNLVGAHGVFAYPHFLDFSRLIFDPAAIALTSICFIIAIVEAIGDTTALAQSGLGRNPTRWELGGALLCDSLNSTVGACFGAMPLTTFAQNVGLVAKTKVVNRFTIFLGALFLVLASFFPPVANLIYTIPDCVMGGTMVVLFGSIAVVGMKEIAELGWSEKNMLIVGLSLCLGFGVSIANVTLGNGNLASSVSVFHSLGIGWLGNLLSNNVLNMFILAILLSWIVPDSFHVKKEKK